MTNIEFEVRPNDWAGPKVLTMLAGTAVISAFGALMLTFPTGLNAVMMIIAVLLALALPVMALHLFTDKIRFDASGITQTSLLRTTRLAAQDIKSYGIYRQTKTRKMCKPIEESAVTKDGVWPNAHYHVVYLSTSAEFDLNEIFPKRNIRLQYRREDFARIRQWMEGVGK